jgi:hypothetical protein
MPFATHLWQGLDSEHFDFFDAQTLQAWVTRTPLRVDDHGWPLEWINSWRLRRSCRPNDLLQVAHE